MQIVEEEDAVDLTVLGDYARNCKIEIMKVTEFAATW